VLWTKLESASILFKREDKVKWALCQINNNAYESHSTFSSWSSLHNDSTKEKIFRKTHKNIFGVFRFSEESNIRRRKIKTRKTIYTGKLPTSKRRNEKSFWVFFYYY
jgi:hypothetical protein